MKTKLFTFFLTLVISVGTLSAQSGTCGENLTWSFDQSTGLLTISGSGEMTDYDYLYDYKSGDYTISTPWYDYHKLITSVSLPAGLTKIGAIAFTYCTGLTSVTIPNGVTSIGDHAFYQCTGLTSVTIPNSVTSVGYAAFYGCTGLTSPVYNAHVFAYMPTSYSGAYTIPDGIESIAGGAFAQCTGLTSVTIPNSITSIGAGAFNNCTGLTSVTIPNSVTSIGDEAFSGTSLTSPVYNAHVFAYMPTSYSGAYTIPDGIESIAGGAFAQCTGLTSVTIPNSITSIGAGAFNNCTGLTSVTIPNSVTSIGTAAFYGCTGFPVIDNIRYADTYLIEAVDKTLSTYTIKDGTKWIGSYAFLECNGLTSVTIPGSVTSIGDEAFVACTGLTSIDIPNSVTSIGNGAFWNCTALASIEIPNSITSIGDNVFYGCEKLEAIYVPCGELERFQTLLGETSSLVKYRPNPYTITALNRGSGSVLVPAITICNEKVQLTANPDRAYYFVRWTDGNTENPRTIELTQDTTMTAIFDYMLEGKCGKDSALTWTLDTTTWDLNIVGKGALSENFTYGTFIKSLTIGNEVTSIGQSAFYGCNNLKNVILGSSVKVLEEGAFYACAVETITCYSQRPPTVNNYALYGLDYSTIVYVPADYLDTYKMHDAWGLYDVRPLGAATRETEDVAVTPHDNTAEVVWPAVSGAATYELVIKDKDGNVICTLVFNANGQLTSIAFVPARDNAPQQTQSAGFAFTVTGLNSGTGYDLTMTSKDGSGETLQAKTVSFTTTGEAPQGIDDINAATKSQKIVRDNQVLILRGDKTYTLTGQEVK